MGRRSSAGRERVRIVDLRRLGIDGKRIFVHDVPADILISGNELSRWPGRRACLEGGAAGLVEIHHKPLLTRRVSVTNWLIEATNSEACVHCTADSGGGIRFRRAFGVAWQYPRTLMMWTERRPVVVCGWRHGI